jgi:hypothetical protein
MATYYVPLEDLRAAAVAANDVKNLFFDLYNYLRERKSYEANGVLRPILPQPLQSPRKLSLFQHPTGPKAD